MICDECGSDNAVYKLVVFMGGQRTERHLCPQCMEKQKAMHEGEVKNLLTTLFKSVQQTGPSEEKSKAQEKDVICPVCGTSLEKVKKGTPLGCAGCYEAFRQPLVQFLSHAGGNARHTGRIPENAAEGVMIRRRAEDLKIEMQLAIACEDYERAAEIRDELKKLQMNENSRETEGESVHA